MRRCSPIICAGVESHCYLGPGDAHIVLTDGAFYTEKTDAVQLLDWVTRLVAGKPVGDVHCASAAAECLGPWAAL